MQRATNLGRRPICPRAPPFINPPRLARQPEPNSAGSPRVPCWRPQRRALCPTVPRGENRVKGRDRWDLERSLWVTRASAPS